MPKYILTSDWHLREDTPPCRTVDILKIQEHKLKQITELQQRHDAVIIHAGDMFHKAKPSPFMLQWAINHMPPNVWAIAGNHDLPYHSNELYDHSGIAVLAASGAIFPIRDNLYTDEYVNIGVFHKFIYREQDEGVFGNISQKFLCDDAPEWVRDEDDTCRIAVFGDNHQCFIWDKPDGEFTVVNPGCLTRQRTSEFSLHPSVCLMEYSETHVFWQTQIWPLEMCPDSTISEEEQEKRKDKDITSFIDSLSHEYEIGLSFKDNIELFLSENKDKLEKEVIEKINNAIWE